MGLRSILLGADPIIRHMKFGLQAIANAITIMYDESAVRRADNRLADEGCADLDAFAQASW